ncbi:MAG: N-acylglucosamine 2-epimerase [Chloroflexi bacterium]|nr:N-acylglucosamine 2-epimerase [Chloroflexota bacterium]
MTELNEVRATLDHIEAYLRETLLPFWIERSPDRGVGGFLTYFDSQGRPTGETVKTFLMQIRMLYTMSSIHRAGLDDGRCAELARMGAEFILDHYWDDAHDGWIWIADRYGAPLVASKIGYGQCFAMYAFSEYFMATGDERGREAALRTYDAVGRHMIDTQRGGYYEIMQPDWRPERPGKFGGDRKSIDVHMHMMEALTNMLEMTGSETHRRRLLEVIGLIIGSMLRAEDRTGYMQFSLDFKPLPAILFDVEWGRDAEPEDGLARPISYTSYGHNVEFAWLLLHAAEILDCPLEEYAGIARSIFDHCIDYGIDRELGGVFVDGPHNAMPAGTEKQFWQQAEVLVGMLDAYRLFGHDRYWDAFKEVYNFVFSKFVNMAGGGEWYERLDRSGGPIDDALGHGWKISYHTVRSMAQSIKRLRLILQAAA